MLCFMIHDIYVMFSVCLQLLTSTTVANINLSLLNPAFCSINYPSLSIYEAKTVCQTVCLKIPKHRNVNVWCLTHLDAEFASWSWMLAFVQLIPQARKLEERRVARYEERLGAEWWLMVGDGD